MAQTDVLLLHAPSVYDFRKRRSFRGPVSDLVPSTSVFEMYPIGFLTLAEYLERHGYRVRILNAALMMLKSAAFDPGQAIKRIDAPVVGIDLHWLVHAHGALEIAALVKKINPRSSVVLGGLSASYFHQSILRTYPQVDYILRGDSTEEPFYQLVEAIGGKRPLENVENLCWRKNGLRVNSLSHVPPTLDHIRLDYSLMVKLVVRYRDIAGALPYLDWMDHPMTMALPFRGCVHGCIACGGSARAYSSFLGRRRLALRSPSIIADEIAAAGELVRGPVFLVHDPRIAGEKFSRELLHQIKSRNTDVRMIFEYFSPPPKEHVRNISSAVPRFDIQISPESHDELVRRAQGRPYTTAALEKAIARSMDAGAGRVDVFFMTGLGGQDAESVRATVSYCGKLMARYPGGQGEGLSAFISPIAPFIDPGSAAFEEPGKHGYRLLFSSFGDHRRALLAPSWKNTLNYETEKMTRDQIAEATYEAAIGLTGLKLEYGRLDARTASDVQERVLRSWRLMNLIDIDPSAAADAPLPSGDSAGGELCDQSELRWPCTGTKLDYARAFRLLLTGR